MGIKEVSVHFIEENLDNIYILDVRAPEEEVDGVIPGSINIPLDLLEAKIQDLPKNKTIYCHCRSGGRSGRAAKYLAKQGYDAVNIAGGVIAWNSIKVMKKA